MSISPPRTTIDTSSRPPWRRADWASAETPRVSACSSVSTCALPADLHAIVAEALHRSLRERRGCRPRAAPGRNVRTRSARRGKAPRAARPSGPRQPRSSRRSGLRAPRARPYARASSRTRARSRAACGRRERERDEAGEGGICGHGRRHSIGVPESTRELSADLQASAPEVPLGLSRAGVTGVQKAVRIGRGSQEKLIAATIDCTVDLDPSQKGVHMSRFPELFEEAIEGVVADDAFLIEDSPSTSPRGSSSARTQSSRRCRSGRATHTSARRR